MLRNFSAPTYTLRSEPPAPEQIVRPFESPSSWPAQRRLPPEQDAGDALIEWSANISVGVTTLDAMFVNSGALASSLHTSRPPTSESDDEEPRPIVLSEIRRTTNTVRVTNPVDPSSWVDVQRINTIYFSSGQGEYVMNFKNIAPPSNPPILYI